MPYYRKYNRSTFYYIIPGFIKQPVNALLNAFRPVRKSCNYFVNKREVFLLPRFYLIFTSAAPVFLDFFSLIFSFFLYPVLLRLLNRKSNICGGKNWSRNSIVSNRSQGFHLLLLCIHVSECRNRKQGSEAVPIL